VVSPWPSFGVYRSLAEARQRPFVPVPLDARGAPCLPALEEALKGWTGSSGTVFVANPNNPTGTSVPVEELRAVAARHPRWLWVVDEAYVEFSTQPRGFQACLPLPANVAVVRTFSKVYALAGLRVGYAVGEGWALKALGRLGDPMPVSRPALAAALGALEDTRRRDRVVRAVRGRREELSQGLQKRGFSVHPSETNFLLVEPPPEVSAEELYGALRREGIRVRRGADLGFPGHLRISVGSGPQHRRLWAVLDRYRMPSSAPSFEASS
jgi:histidinol-phosphate aminotransferase